MSHNSFGHLFRVTTFGESHGAALGCVVDGAPPGLPLTEAEIQRELDRRRPGQSRFTTQRREPDEVRILSGVFEDASGRQVTTGTPIALAIENVDQRSKDYSDIRDLYRPGHADYTYDAKYGIRDWRGSGRASARETASRVAAGGIARKVVPGMSVRGALVQIGEVAIDRSRWDWDEVDRNPFFCPDAATATIWADYLDGVRKRGSSVGAVIEVVADGQPVVVRFAVKPTSSILNPRRTINRAGEEVDVSTKGRHDPCVGIRAVPIGEAMLAIVLADQYLRHRGQVGIP